jgi:segregation and condensation protein A
MSPAGGPTNAAASAATSVTPNAASGAATTVLAAGLTVRVESGVRPETSTHVMLETWEGPLGLLLALIEARQLDVMSVLLGSLADAYLDALATLDEDRMGHVSSFVAIASSLILIKSRALLPRREAEAPIGLPDEGPDPEAELRARLILYKAYRDAGAALQVGALERFGLFRREPDTALAAAMAGARPVVVEPLDPALLVHALDGLARIAPPPPPPPETIPRTITLADRAAVIRAALREAGTIVLQDLLRGVRDRVVVAVTFLALLELMKRREIVVEQAEPWGPIVARPTTAEERAAAGVEAVDADEPLDEALGSFA